MKSLPLFASLTTATAISGSMALIAGTWGSSRPLQAAIPPSRPATLSFDMTARFASKDAQAYAATAEQTIEAKVYVDGRRVRAESQSGDHPVVYLYAPPYGYKLLPTSKSGLRYHVTPSNLPINPANSTAILDPQSLLPLLQNPSALRTALQKQGVQRTGTAQLNGMPVDIYVSNNFKGKPIKIKAWLRHSDALPARLELVSKKLSVAASWRNYQRGRVLSNTLFAVPAGYHIRDAQGHLNN